MFLVNNFGRVVEINDEARAKLKIKQKRLRPATDIEVARFFADREAEKDDETSIYYQSVRQAPDGYGMSRSHIKEQLDALGVRLAETYNDQKVGLLYNYPYSIKSLRTPVRLVYTMFETDKIPEEWPEYLKMADEVIVPSRWCQKVFLQSGIKSTVVPLGYNDDIYQFIQRDFETSEPFTFIHYDSFNLRKGFLEVFKAFTEEFTKADNVRLVLKTIHQNTSIPILKSEFPQIDVIRGHLDEKELAELLGKSHCMVYPSRGEGFGITPIEAMATGLPAIVPNAHGISEYFNSNYMLEVKVGGHCPGLVGRFKEQDIGEMVICDVEDLKKQMRWAFEHRSELYELGRSASEYVQRYSYKQTAIQLKKILDRWQNAKVTERKDSKYLQVERV